MTYQILSEAGVPLKATVETSDGVAIFHSRGGTIGSANERNRDYSTALRLILKRIELPPENRTLTEATI